MTPFPPGAAGGATPVFLAPMAGFTDAAMRLVCHRRGASFAYTEMACATGLLRQPAATLRLLEKHPGEGPLAAHLFGADPAEMAAAAEIAASLGRFAAIDVNAGCPMRKVTSRGCGAALMARPGRVAEIIRRMRDAQPLPVTLKTRLGLSPGEPPAFDILAAAQDAGAAAITIHARYAADIHSGPPNLPMLARFVERARIPVVGNGGITCGRDARVMARETGVSAVMIGRAALGNPRVFTRVADALALPRGADDRLNEPARPGPLEACADFLEHLDALTAGGTDARRTRDAVAAFRRHLFRYFSGMRGAARLRANLSTLHTAGDIRRAAIECAAGQIEE